MKEIPDLRLRNAVHDAHCSIIDGGDGTWRAWTVLLDSSACYEFESFMQLEMDAP